MASTLWACDRYVRENDTVYDVPDTDNYLSGASFRALNDAIENYPKSAENYYKRALFHYRKDNYDKTFDDVQSAIKADNQQAKYYFLLSQVYRQNKEFKKALSAILHARKLAPKNPETLIQSGELLLINQKFDASGKTLNLATQMLPKDPRIDFIKGNLALEKQDTANAKRFLFRAIRKRPDYANAYNSLATLFNRYDMPKTAIKYASKGLEYEPEHDYLNYNKAEAYRQRRKVDSARVFYKKTYQTNPEIYQASYYLGRYTFDLGKYKEAQEYLENTLKYNRKFERTHYYLGLCYTYQNLDQKALKTLKTAMEQDPNHIASRDAYWGIRNKIKLEELRRREDSIRQAYYEQEQEYLRKLREKEKKRQEAYKKMLQEQQERVKKQQEEYQRKLKEQQDRIKKQQEEYRRKLKEQQEQIKKRQQEYLRKLKEQQEKKKNGGE
ncbi:tetratricopeptide repeat protein [Microscilla marina]|nr:tetratricopeptide repeat protein [Microscilla marina]